MNEKRACVVLPTYNERENLPRIVPAILAASPELDVLVVDDSSPDGTGAMADELAARDPRVRVLHRKRKEGLGRAYLAGFAQALGAGYGRILEMDADFSHDPARLPALLGTEADLVLGSRYVPGGSTVNWGLGRRILSRGAACTLAPSSACPSGTSPEASSASAGGCWRASISHRCAPAGTRSRSS